MEIDAHETIQQLGGRGITGALVYCGTKQLIKSQDTLKLLVNGRRGYKTFINIQLDPSDTYNVFITTVRGGKFDDYERQEHVYCDELKTVVEEMYDQHMREHNNGFIPMG